MSVIGGSAAAAEGTSTSEPGQAQAGKSTGAGSTAADKATPASNETEKSEALCRLYMMEVLFLPSLTSLVRLDKLWSQLGACLTELNKSPDSKAVLQLKSLVEAFFIMHKVLYLC